MTTEMLLDLGQRRRGLVDRVMARLKVGAKRRSLRQHLLDLDDHLLRDVGLTRHQVLSDEF